MMNLTTKYILTAVVCGVMATNLFAQDPLSKEIVVEKDYRPTEKGATRLVILPKATQFTLPQSRLDFSFESVPTNPGNSIATLIPYGYKTNRSFGAPRGYFDFGVGNGLDMLGSAGYRFVDNENTVVGLWAQHNSEWGIKNNIDFCKISYLSGIVGNISKEFERKHTDEWIGAYITHKFGENTSLKIDASYHFGRMNYMQVSNLYKDADADCYQLFNNINQVNVVAQLDLLNRGNEDYTVGASINTFSNSVPVRFYEPKTDFGAKELLVALYGGIAHKFDDNASACLNVKLSVLNLDNDTAINENKGSKDKLIFTLSPCYNRQFGKVKLNVGLNLDISANDGSTFSIAPNVKLFVPLMEKVSLALDASGGKNFNTMSAIYSQNRYATPVSGNYLANYTPIDAKLKVNVGGFSGFSSNVWVGYAISNNCIQLTGTPELPYKMSPNDAFIGLWSSCKTVDLKGAAFGAELKYEYGNLFSVDAKGAYCQQNGKTGYSAFGLDRPEYMVNVDATVNPINKLSVGIGWEFRGNRSLWSEMLTQRIEIADYNNLSVKAHYSFTPMVGVWAQLNNILNSNNAITEVYTGQKFSAMGGVTLQF